MRKIALILSLLLVDMALAKADEWGCTSDQKCFVRAIDGDTIQIGAGRYRLCGVDAPELGTQVGNQAMVWLHREIFTRVFNGGGEELTCLPVGYGTPCDGRSEKHSYGRIVAQCFIGGDDIAELLVEHGFAQDVPRFSGGYYRTEL